MGLVSISQLFQVVCLWGAAEHVPSYFCNIQTLIVQNLKPRTDIRLWIMLFSLLTKSTGYLADFRFCCLNNESRFTIFLRQRAFSESIMMITCYLKPSLKIPNRQVLLSPFLFIFTRSYLITALIVNLKWRWNNNGVNIFPDVCVFKNWVLFSSDASFNYYLGQSFRHVCFPPKI